MENPLDELERRISTLENWVRLKFFDCCRNCSHSQMCEQEFEHMIFCQGEHDFVKDTLKNGSYYDDSERFILEEYDE